MLHIVLISIDENLVLSWFDRLLHNVRLDIARNNKLHINFRYSALL